LTTRDWEGDSGEQFRTTVKDVGEFCRDHGLCAEDLASLASIALSGAANEKAAKVLRDIAETERIKVEAEISRRNAEPLFRKNEADAESSVQIARKAKADADLAEISVTAAKLELFQKFSDLGVAWVETEIGIEVIPTSPRLSLLDLSRNSRQDASLRENSDCGEAL
jgi:hypothetical protein